jgi:hypothetical protein
MEAFSPKKLKMLKEDIDYRFVVFTNSENTGVELLLDKYKGVVYYYEGAKVEELDGNAKLKFDYGIVKSGNYEESELINDSDFHTLIGDILVELITTGNDNEPPRNDYTEKSDLL